MLEYNKLLMISKQVLFLTGFLHFILANPKMHAMSVPCWNMSFGRLLLLVLVVQLGSSHNFTDDQWDSFDAYGVKLAANDVVIVQARNKDARFVLQFAPFVASNLSSPCYVDYMTVGLDDTSFIYSIVVPKEDLNDASIVFIGENDGQSTSPYPFVGHMRVNSSCQKTYDIQSFSTQVHNEFYVLGIDPTGEVAYGFAGDFAFSYDLHTNNITYLQPWPIANFMPHATDVSNAHVAVIAGFYAQTQNTCRSLVYMLMLNLSSFTVLDHWEYIPVNSSWQAKTLCIDAANFTGKHVMSVSIQSNTSQVLVGVPSMNIVFWFYMSANLTLAAYRENGNQRGYGQSLGWSNEYGGPFPVVLGNTYDFPYTWSSSIIYWFTLNEFVSSDPIMPLFPTIQYPRWIELEAKLISIATANVHVALLDSSGQIYVIVSAPTGSYPDTSAALGFNPAFSTPTLCPSGSYKDWVGIYICYLCPLGHMSDSAGSIECSPYDCTENNAFCPLGSITNDTYSDLNTVISEQPRYPESPETTNIDDILIMNMFTFGDSSRCLVISPLFWMMIMTFIASLIIILMGVLKFFRQYANVRLTLKRIFRQADLIREGEVWIGGLASFALLVLLLFSYIFSSAFLNQYPIETASPSTFACDTTIRNAQFETNLQSLATALSDDEQQMFNMLDEQQFILTIDFINTQLTCKDVSISQIIHANPKAISFNCTYDRSMLSLSTALESHILSMTYDFVHAKPIGGFRIRLYGEQKQTSDTLGKSSYLVRELDYNQPFLLNNHTLAYDPSVEIRLTRIINKTQPLDDTNPYEFTALWAPKSIASISKLFLTFEEYLYYGLLKTSFSISISEMSYYMMNVQKPITKRAEIIFHNLLFTTVCMELFGLAYLTIKLFFLPIFHHIRVFVEKRSNIVHPEPTSEPSELFVDTMQKQPSPPTTAAVVTKHNEKIIRRSTCKKKIVPPTYRLKK